MRVAVVDLGTNTCRLFLAEVGADGAVKAAGRFTTVVRLGQDADRLGHLHPDAKARTRTCLAEYAERIEAYGPQRRVLVATSAARRASDGRAFLAEVGRAFALPVCVVSGEREGSLTFRGASAEFAAELNPLLLIDIGGGSTELVVGAPGGSPSFVCSLEIGVVRLTERFLLGDPPLAAELEALSAHIARAIRDEAPAEVRGSVRGAVGVAGTFSTLAAHELGLRVYRPEVIHRHTLTLEAIDEAIAVFRRLPSTRIGRLPGIQRGREDVILAGAVIAREVCIAFGLGGVQCSETGLLEGAAAALAEGELRGE